MLNYSYTPKWSDLLKIIYPFKKKKKQKYKKYGVHTIKIYLIFFLDLHGQYF